ncbi:MAG: Trm112 family protein [Paracoccaceae bacterium]
MSDEIHNDSTPAVSHRLLESLVCPATGGRLTWDPDRQELISKSANLAYPIRQGIPIMLIDEARMLED